MYSVMIVDDEMIIRSTLHSMVNWESMGFGTVRSADNGERAYQMIREKNVDLLITDIKMPIMDGLSLLKEVKKLQRPPVVIVLSGYNDFDLVREAFLLGAYDYLLKADINEGTLTNTVQKVISGFVKNQQEDEIKQITPTRSQQMIEMALGKREVDEKFFHGAFILIQFEIDGYLEQVKRFGSDLESTLNRPMLDLAMQIPRVTTKCIIGDLSSSRYLLLYQFNPLEEQTYEAVQSICKQVGSVWKNYMNISVSAGISSIGNSARLFLPCFKESGRSLTAKHLYGKGSVHIYGKKEYVDIDKAIEADKYFCGFKELLLQGDERILEAINSIISNSDFSGLEDKKRVCIYIVYHIGVILKDSNSDIATVFGQDINYIEKIDRIDSAMGLEIWMTNIVRFIMDYIEHHYARQQADIMEKAKRFLRDNYHNPEMTLGMAAGYVGLNEKYFSNRFTKEVGNTFSNYLTDLRMQKAKELLRKTDLKMYEVSSSVGYNNVEHFTRVFKKEFNCSPSSYKKEDK